MSPEKPLSLIVRGVGGPMGGVTIRGSGIVVWDRCATGAAAGRVHAGPHQEESWGRSRVQSGLNLVASNATSDHLQQPLSRVELQQVHINSLLPTFHHLDLEGAGDLQAAVDEEGHKVHGFADAFA
ncbi:hypothetical protein HaLaN_04208 [Haematococcus lacustris]|uniref:Uncharacterized protein n=1 Tax=Haematococcus lacustris TaxID=44745 RepID=A0A699YS58_HAELA|nr:hypothetical protein HaLaN_04208 [Haematococcus lacustris]